MNNLNEPCPSAVRWGLDPAAVLELNAAEEVATSPLNAAALEALLQDAFLAAGVDRGRSAFLIAFDETAHYEGTNYQWFRARYSRFVYIDRIVVAESARGRGLARQLYAQLAAQARESGRLLVTCEINFEPPNPISDAFHAAMGFHEVGRGRPVPHKLVRYLAWPLDTAKPDA
jgi:predicted GNAT superfamily acetyltransferase